MGQKGMTRVRENAGPQPAGDCGRPDRDAKLVLGLPQGGRIRGSGVRLAAKILLSTAALALGACSMPDTDSFRIPDASTLFRPMSVTNYKDNTLPPVAQADLVDAGGSCAGAYVPAPAGADQPAGQAGVSLQQAGVPLIPATIALEMSECDVVKRAGIAEKVEIGANDRKERTARLTYTRGQFPGIYNFVDGRLRLMERAPEPPAPAKPAKKPAKSAKPVAKRTPPSQISVQ